MIVLAADAKLPERVMVLRKIERQGPFRPGKVLAWSEELQCYVCPAGVCGVLVKEWFVRERWGDLFGEVPPEQLDLIS